MFLTWTTEQVLALAPDAASAKAGRDLAAPPQSIAEAMVGLGIPAFACTPVLLPEMIAAATNRQDMGQWAAKNDIVTAR